MVIGQQIALLGDDNARTQPRLGLLLGHAVAKEKLKPRVSILRRSLWGFAGADAHHSRRRLSRGGAQATDTCGGCRHGGCSNAQGGRAVGLALQPLRLERGHDEQQAKGDCDGLRENQPNFAHKGSPMLHRQDMESHLQQLLSVSVFKDYGPNGLQVEGKTEVHKIVSGVTASLALIEAAVEHKADALLVHHGLFWRGHDGRVTGWLKRRLELLLAHQINLFAYHLPLDAHPLLGNNAQLGQRLGWTVESHFGEQALGCLATVPQVYDLPGLSAWLETQVRHPIVMVPGDGRALRRLAWCTGGAQSYFEAAIAAGADAFITGEISEPQAHYARESGVAFLACGHHASERYGVQALGHHLASQFGIEHLFIDIDNPA